MPFLNQNFHHGFRRCEHSDEKYSKYFSLLLLQLWKLLPTVEMTKSQAVEMAPSLSAGFARDHVRW